MSLINSALSAMPVNLPAATPFYRIYMSLRNAPFSDENEVTAMLQSRISSLTITRRKSTSKSPQPLGEASITLREPLDESFFLGLPGVGMDKESKEGIRSARFGFKIGYRNMSPLDLIGTGRHYKQGKFLPKDQVPVSPLDTFIMKPTALVLVGKLGMPTFTGSDKGEFSGSMKFTDTMATPTTMYDPLNKFSPSSKLNAALKAEAKLGSAGLKDSKRAKRVLKSYSVNPAIVPVEPGSFSPLLLFKQLFKDLFQTQLTYNDETPATFKLDTQVIELNPRFIIPNPKFALAKNTYTQERNENRYAFFKRVLDDFAIDFFIRYSENGVAECVLYPKGRESFVYLTPIDADAGKGIPSTFPFAINAIYGLNVVSFDFSADAAGPTSGGATAVALNAGEPGNPFKEEVVLTFSQDKMNAWVDKQKKANRAAGVKDDFENITLINQQFMDMQTAAASSTAAAEVLYKTWYEKAPAVHDPAAKITNDIPGLGQKLKLKFRYALPGLVPGMFINFEGMESKSPSRSLSSTSGFKPAVKPGAPAEASKKSNNIPDVIAGRYTVNEVTFSFQPNASFTMEVQCSR